MEKTIHQGRNVKRFREMLGLKQEALAYELGEDWNQRKISLLEQKDVIDDALLDQVAKVLKVPVEAFKNFDEEAAFNIISNTYNNTSNEHSTLIASSVNYQPTFNTIDKVIELYDKLLKEKDEKIALMEKMLGKK